MYTGDDCMQLGFYFPTNNPLGNRVNKKIVICNTTDMDIEGCYVHNVFNKLSNNSLSNSMLSRMRDVLIRIYKFVEGSTYMELLTSTGDLRRIELPLKIRLEYEQSKDKTILYRHALYYEGLESYTPLTYNNEMNKICPIKI